MKYFTALSFSATILFSSYAAFAAKNSYPAILCVDAADYWDGPYTVEISVPNTLGQVFASIYDQSREGRFLIDSIPVQQKISDTQVSFIGKNFSFEMAKENFALKDKSAVSISFFQDDYGLINGVYACLFF